MTGVQRAVLLVSASSILVPAVGLATAPVLAHSLGAEGRGVSAAAAAPFLVASTVGSLGLPQALTYFVAQGRPMTRTVLVTVGVIAVAAGLGATAAIAIGRSYLSGGDSSVALLILIGSSFVVPALLVGLVRGIAIGLQMWREVALDRVLQTACKAAGIIGLAVTGRLDVLAAVLVLCVSPVVGVLAYWRLLGGRVPRPAQLGAPPLKTPTVLRYGSSVWLGSVALMVMARVNELFVLPLSDAEQLGLLVVAVTVSDIPWIVTQALRDVLFGTSSKDMDRDLLTRASRLATAGAAVLGVAIGATMPFWLHVVFGEQFGAALWPTAVLLASAAVAVPGLVAGAGLEADGRPRARSLTLVGALAVNLVLVFALVPALGAVGGACAVLGSTTFSSVVTVWLAVRALDVRPSHFIGIRRADVRLIAEQLHNVRSAVGTRSTRSGAARTEK